MARPAAVLDGLDRWHPLAVCLLGGALVVVLGVGDVVTGSELSSSVFYVFPVGLAAWYAGVHYGMGLSLVAAVTWYTADLTAGATYSAAWIPAWNGGVRLAFFVIITLLLGRLREALEAQRALAERDPLTGLANGRRFRAAVEAEVARSARYAHPVSLAYIDLDGFKGVNDRLGHHIGDEVLAEVGRALAAHVRRTDIPARLGGDEFAVLFPETGAQAVADAVAKLQASLERVMASREWPVGFSTGVVTALSGVDSGEALVQLADELMYEVKRSGKGRATFRTVDGHPPLQAPAG